MKHQRHETRKKGISPISPKPIGDTPFQTPYFLREYVNSGVVAVWLTQSKTLHCLCVRLLSCADIIATMTAVTLRKNGRELTGVRPKCGGDDRFYVTQDNACACRKCHTPRMDAESRGVATERHHARGSRYPVRWQAV